MPVTSTTRVRIVLPLIATVALFLSSCGDGDAASTGGVTSGASTASKAPSGPDLNKKNAADVAFVSGMIPHHRQALEMAELALDKADNAKVTNMAERVKAAQEPEIETMSALLAGWGEPVPAATGKSESMPGMDHGDEGLMSAAQMRDLAKAAGGEFDVMWVEMMIAHHQGAVAMSKTEISEGVNGAAQQLARTITDAQTKEIGELQRLRTELA